MALLEELLAANPMAVPTASEPAVAPPAFVPQNSALLDALSSQNFPALRAPANVRIKEAAKDFAGNFLFTLGEALKAGATAPGGRGTQAGMGAAFQAPMVLQQLRAEQARKQQEEDLKTAQFIATTKQQGIQAALQQRQAAVAEGNLAVNQRQAELEQQRLNQPKTLPERIQEYNLVAQQEREAGRTPPTFPEFLRSLQKPDNPPTPHTVTTEEGVFQWMPDAANKEGGTWKKIGNRPKTGIEQSGAYASLNATEKAKVDAVAKKVASGEYTIQNGLSALGGVRGGMGGALTEALADIRVLPVAVRTANADIERAKSLLVPVRQLVAEINSTKNPADKVVKSARLENYVRGIGTQFARARGERGVVTDEDVNRVLGLIPGWKAANFAPKWAEDNLKLIDDAFNRDQTTLLKKYFTTFEQDGGTSDQGGTGGGAGLKLPDDIRKKLMGGK